MAVFLSPVGGAGAQFFDANGTPLSGGKLYTYLAGTTTPAVTYTSSAGNTANSNPIVLDSAGRVSGSSEIWLTSGTSYKFVLKTNDDVLQVTWDNISGNGDPAFSFYTPDTTSLLAPGPLTIKSALDDITNEETGSSFVGYLAPFAGAIAVTTRDKLAQCVSVKDFGAVGDGVTSDYAAFNLALAQSGTVFVPSGTYKLDGQVVLAQDNTTLLLAANVTLLVSNVPAVQTPVFGNQIHITGKGCAVIGSGPSSLIQAADGTYANGIGFRGDYGSGLVQNLTLDGDKNSTTAQADDSFGAGVMIAGYENRTASKVVIDNCTIRNWNQYGIDNYNNTGATTVTNCTIHDNGVAAQSYSVGIGIINSAGVNDFIATNNVIFNNKLDGISSNSAYDCYNYAISNNSILNNGGNGIVFTQQPNYGCVTGKGINYITVTGNNVSGNNQNGIVFSTDKGYLKYVTCTGNVCVDNTVYGIFAISTDTSNQITDIAITGNTTSANGTGGIGIGQYVANWSSIGNILNDVSQNITGTFTPVVEGVSTAGTATYSDQRGTYSKIGNVVFYQIALDWTGHTGTGQMKITGFPFAASSTAPQSPAFAAPNSFTVTGQVFALPIGGQAYALMYSENNGTTGPLSMDAAASMVVSGSYATDI